MGSPVSPIVVNLYMEIFEQKALASFEQGIVTKWFRYVDDTFVVIKEDRKEAFFEHINNVDVDVYRKPTHTDQYLLFDSCYPLEHKLGVIRTLEYRDKTVCSSEERVKAEKSHIRGALAKCGYPRWVFDRAHVMKQNKEKVVPKDRAGSNTIVTIPYIPELSEKLKKSFKNFNIQVCVKPCNTL